MSNSSTYPHILPLSLYLKIGSVLIFLTVITVGAAQINFGEFNLLIAMLIAGIKATLVAMYFMHLKYDNKLYSIAFLISLICLAVFIAIILFDTMRRDDLNPIRGGHVNPVIQMYRTEEITPAETESAPATESGSDQKAEETTEH